MGGRIVRDSYYVNMDLLWFQTPFGVSFFSFERSGFCADAAAGRKEKRYAHFR